MAVFCNFTVKPRSALQPGELIRLKGTEAHPLSLVMQASSTTELSCIMLESSGIRPAFSILRPQDEYVSSFGFGWVCEILDERDQIVTNGNTANFGNVLIDDESAFLIGRIPSGFGDPFYFDLNAHRLLDNPKRRTVVARKWRLWARVQDLSVPGRAPLLEVDGTSATAEDAI